MQVILKKDLPHLGKIGEVVSVKPGYARNYLLPRSLAIIANIAHKKSLEHQKRLIEIHKQKIRKDSEILAEKMKALVLTLKRRFNESGRMFGSVTASDIAAVLTMKGYSIDRRDISFDPIKEVGSYPVQVRLPGDAYVPVQVVIEAEAIQEVPHKEKKTRKTNTPRNTKPQAATKKED